MARIDNIQLCYARARRGWTRIYGLSPKDNDLLDQIRKSGVQQDPIAALNMHVYVPDWVATAVKAYCDGGGFAGLSLKEYLDKIGGDFKAKK